MDEPRAASKIPRDIAMFVVAVVIGIAPWLLDKIGVEMPRWVYISFLGLSAILVWWVLADLGWLKWLERIPGTEKLWGHMRNLAILCVIYYVFVGHPVVYTPPPPITPDNIQGRLKILLSDAGYTCSPGANELYAFYFDCPVSGQLVGVGVFRSREDWLVVSIKAYPTQDQMISLKRRQPSEAHKLLRDIRIETSRLGFGYDAKRHNLEEEWLMRKDVHIDSEMKDSLLDTIQRLPLAVAVIQQTINKQLNVTSDITPP